MSVVVLILFKHGLTFKNQLKRLLISPGKPASHYLDTWDSSSPPRWWVQHKGGVGSWQWSRESDPAGSSSVCSCRCPSAPHQRMSSRWSGRPLSLELYLLLKENKVVWSGSNGQVHTNLIFSPNAKVKQQLQRNPSCNEKALCTSFRKSLFKMCHFSFFIKHIISLGCFSFSSCKRADDWYKKWWYQKYCENEGFFFNVWLFETANSSSSWFPSKSYLTMEKTQTTYFSHYEGSRKMNSVWNTWRKY